MFAPAQIAPLTEADILAALRDCYDPEVPLNIVDLGLIDNISLAPDADAPGFGIRGVPPRQRVDIALMLTSPGCGAEKQIIAQIENRLAAFETVSRVSVSLVWEPRWSTDRITAEGRARLDRDLTSKQHPNGLIQIQKNPGETKA